MRSKITISFKEVKNNVEIEVIDWDWMNLSTQKRNVWGDFRSVLLVALEWRTILWLLVNDRIGRPFWLLTFDSWLPTDPTTTPAPTTTLIDVWQTGRHVIFSLDVQITPHRTTPHKMCGVEVRTVVLQFRLTVWNFAKIDPHFYF